MEGASSAARRPSIKLQLSLAGKEKDELSALRNPLSTFKHFFLASAKFICWCHRWLVFPAFIGGFIFFLIKKWPEIFYNVWSDVAVATWWICLGIVSSIGLGSGFPSGLLFLIPHLYSITASAQTCKALNFDWRVNSWAGQMKQGQLFECNSANLAHSIFLWSVPSAFFPKCILQNHLLHNYLLLVLYALPSFLLWGVGTVLGELPPYFAAYQATKARFSDQTDFSHVQAKIHNTESKTCYGRLKSRIRSCTANFVNKYGSVAVFAFSAWPNVFFDICGMLCGYFLMPAWKFLLALWLGKGVVKVTIQCLVATLCLAPQFNIFLIETMQRLANSQLLAQLTTHFFGSTKNFEKTVTTSIDKLRRGFHLEEFSQPSLIQSAFSWGSRLAIVYVTVCFVGHIASVHYTQAKETGTEQTTKNTSEQNKKLSEYPQPQSTRPGTPSRRSKRPETAATTTYAESSTSGTATLRKKLTRARSASPGVSLKAAPKSNPARSASPSLMAKSIPLGDGSDELTILPRRSARIRELNKF